LQHGQQLNGVVEQILTRAGFQLTSVADAHLCCGSAGTYSILQPALSERLLDNKLAALEREAPDIIATANIGCQMYLGTKAGPPVRHWIELVDEAMS
jgi:glycolate oxidase iron-sulfur subunit